MSYDNIPAGEGVKIIIAAAEKTYNNKFTQKNDKK